eukprot:CAMPEP_0202950310 /NCGR_PEP_ID=MMETSP1395-20130829/21131_1 /ASSEMBLY_ACC=CAM_ASM_000871 /TAXON_ID=5961 /ORGANISM="Blepharisma japonicum, Strain Stock R1072" /LENGTH=63 /DNA_ID=CAMNT_0049654557 /DNA_START=228 /DNA_END=419 /DNA_ORIENTATION=+
MSSKKKFVNQSSILSTNLLSKKKSAKKKLELKLSSSENLKVLNLKNSNEKLSEELTAGYPKMY